MDAIYNVFIDVPIDKGFDYVCADDLRPGTRIRVVFNRRHTIGVINRRIENSRIARQKLSDIYDVLDNAPWFSELSLEFLTECARDCFAGPGEVIVSALPRPLKVKTRHFDVELPHRKKKQKGRFLIVRRPLVQFREEYLREIKKHNGPVMIVVESKFKAENLAGRFEGIFNNRPVFTYSNEIAYEQLTALCESIACGRRPVIIGTRHLSLFPVVDDELFVVENAWMDVYRQEVFPRYNVKDVLRKRSLYGGGRYLVHEVLKNNSCKIMHIDGTIHRQFPAFIEEEIKSDVLNGKRWAVLGLGGSFARSVVCLDCKRTMVCDKCSGDFVVKKKGKSSYLFCKSCGKTIPWDFRCLHCGGAAVALKGWGVQRIFALIKEKLAGIAVFEEGGQGDKGPGVYMFEHWQNLEAKFDKALLLGIDSVVNIGVFFSKELAIGFMWSASNLVCDSLYVHTRLTDITDESALAREFSLRKRFGLPPYGRLINLIFKARAYGLAVRHAHKFVSLLEKHNLSGYIYMPLHMLKQERKRRQYYAGVSLLMNSEDSQPLESLYAICLKMRGKKGNTMIPEIHKEALLSMEGNE